jgi:hypothetical protein
VPFVLPRLDPDDAPFGSGKPHQVAMEMKKVACAVLVAAASATVVLAAEAPAPAPTSASSAAFPAVGAVLGASVLSFFAYYLQ